jgi:hypothetical protein
MRNLALIAVLLLHAACATVFIPRSAAIGQTAQPLGAGGTEMGITAGAAYSVITEPANDNGTVTSGNSLQLPALEANFAYGLAETVSLNLHGSQAGVQPGAKITLLRGPISFALLPQLGLGYISTHAQDVRSGETTPRNQDDVSGLCLLVGARALLSHSSGFYAALGYDYQSVSFTSVSQNGTNPPSQPVKDSWVVQNLSLGAGYDVPLGRLSLRPEIAFIFSPSLSVSESQNNTTVTRSGGSAWGIFPSVTISAGSSTVAVPPPPVP